MGQKEGCKEVEEVGRCWEVALPVSQGSKSLLILINLIGLPLQTDSKINFLRISRWQVQSSKLQARDPYEHWTLCDCFGLRLVSLTSFFGPSILDLFSLCVLSSTLVGCPDLLPRLLCSMSHLSRCLQVRVPGHHSTLVALYGNCTHLVS